MYRCRFVLTNLSGPEEETQVSKKVLSTPIWNSIQEISCWEDDLWWSGRWLAWADALPLVFPVVISHRICYYSCLVYLWTPLSGFLHSSGHHFADRHAWKAWSQKLHVILEKYPRLPGEDSTTWLSHLIWEESTYKMTVAESQMTQINCIYTLNNIEDDSLRVTVVS